MEVTALFVSNLDEIEATKKMNEDTGLDSDLPEEEYEESKFNFKLESLHSFWFSSKGHLVICFHDVVNHVLAKYEKKTYNVLVNYINAKDDVVL